jgi:hypothetical protein
MLLMALVVVAAALLEKTREVVEVAVELAAVQLAQGGLMVEVALKDVLRLVVWVQSVLSGPVQPVHSHLLVQVTCK